MLNAVPNKSERNALKAYEKIWQLHAKGWSTRAIAKQVRLSSRTVQRHQYVQLSRTARTQRQRQEFIEPQTPPA